MVKEIVSTTDLADFRALQAQTRKYGSDEKVKSRGKTMEKPKLFSR